MRKGVRKKLATVNQTVARILHVALLSRDLGWEILTAMDSPVCTSFVPCETISFKATRPMMFLTTLMKRRPDGFYLLGAVPCHGKKIADITVYQILCQCLLVAALSMCDPPHTVKSSQRGSLRPGKRWIILWF